jgi:hypothetical protein
MADGQNEPRPFHFATESDGVAREISHLKFVLEDSMMMLSLALEKRMSRRSLGRRPRLTIHL